MSLDELDGGEVVEKVLGAVLGKLAAGGGGDLSVEGVDFDPALG